MKLFAGLFFVLLTIISCNTKNENVNTETENKKTTALDELNKRIYANAGDIDALYQRSKIYLDQKKIQLAYNDIAIVISADSMKYDYNFTYADILFASMKMGPCVKSFEKCIAIDPKKYEPHLKLAELYLYVKEYQKSIDYANSALRIDKNLSKAYFIKGFVYKESGDTARAISSFQTVSELEPKNYDAYIQLGNIETARKSKIALQYYDNALRVDPKSTEAMYNKGLFYQNNNELNKAIEEYTAILKIDPAYYDAHYNLGYIHLVTLKEYDQAIRHFTGAIQSDQRGYGAYYMRGVCYESLGNIAAAKADFLKSLELNPAYDLPKNGLKRIGS